MRTSPKISAASRHRAAAAMTALLLVVSADLPATGWPPFTRDDFIIVEQGSSTSVLSSGAQSVLANDFDFERDPMTVVLDKGPNHGELILNGNGTFLYQHNGNNANNDEFRYRAFDGTGYSRVTSVDIEILPSPKSNLELRASVAVNPVMIGEPATWRIVIDNDGPADLDDGELIAQWATSGPGLSLTAPGRCSVSGNNGPTPSVECTIDDLDDDESTTVTFSGTMDSDGDNSMIAAIFADDPQLGNNVALIGSQVVAGFSEGPAQILNISGDDIATGDLNGDGELDLVVTADDTKIFFNDGGRGVATPGSGLGPQSGGAATAVLDWNGDGSQDIAVGGTGSVEVKIFLNDGNGGFGDAINLQVNEAGVVRDIAAADFEQNGSWKIVIAGSARTLLLEPSGQSGSNVRSLPAGAGIDASIADINNDTYADIVIVEGDRDVQVLINSGNGRSFNNQRLQRGSVASATAADMNGDGDADLLLAIDGADLTLPESLVLYQQSNGNFSAGDPVGASALSKLLGGDVDGDRVADIVAVNYAGVHQAYSGNAGGFDLNPEQIVSAGMRRGELVDLNADGSLDLILAGSAAGNVEIHLNNGRGKLGLGDRTPPVVTLIGDAVISIPAGAGYQDPGATAFDDIDGDVTASIVTSGNFNPAVVGTYQVTYSANDRAGNIGTAQRTFNVGVNQGVGGGGGGGAAGLLLIFALGLFLIPGVCRRLNRN